LIAARTADRQKLSALRNLPPPVQIPSPLASAADFRLRVWFATASIAITAALIWTVISSCAGEFVREIDLIRPIKFVPVKRAMELFEFLLIGFFGLITLVPHLALFVPVLPVLAALTPLDLFLRGWREIIRASIVAPHLTFLLASRLRKIAG
jgi:hypothetical protein